MTVRTINDGRIAFETVGSGAIPVVAVPGIGDLRDSYRALAPKLAEAGCTVYLMDLRGHGASDVGFDSYTSEDIGEDVRSLLEDLDLRNAVLLGNSIGAAAIAHTSLVSDRVDRLVMLSGFVGDPPYFGVIRLVLGVLFAPLWGVWMWGMYRKTLFQTKPDDFVANHQAVLANLRQPGRRAAMTTMLKASKAGINARLGEVSVPALIAMGAQDPDFPDPAQEAQSQARQLGGQNRVVMIDDAGHYPQVEQPEDTVRAILAFMKEN